MTPPTRHPQVTASADRILADRRSAAAFTEHFEAQMSPEAKGAFRRRLHAIGQYVREGLDFAGFAYGYVDSDRYPGSGQTRHLKGWCWPW